MKTRIEFKGKTIRYGEAPHPKCPCSNCNNTGAYPSCSDCGGNDGHPREHCMDCGKFDNIHPNNCGCKCGFMGYANEPVYQKVCGPCKQTEKCK